MEKDVLDRIVALEKEVHELRKELGSIRNNGITKPNIVDDTKQLATQERQNSDKWFALNKKPPVLVEPVEVVQHVAQRQEEKAPEHARSLEEVFVRALPKIFIVILALGVLWGLKLVSDYGFLSDSVKIVFGFVLSVALGIYASIMERKKKGSRTVALSLYGGTFIIGILTTAAGAILYDVLSLYMALVIAVLYIVYGIAISYGKGNEALTVLVIFTSLLLPYLLEYMAFSAIIIGLFIVLLFGAIQVVIVKHKQRKALYIGYVCSMLATCIVAGFHTTNTVFFTGALVLLFAMFLASFIYLYNKSKKLQAVHAGLFFSFTLFTLSAINGLLFAQEVALLTVLTLFLSMLAFVAYRMYQRAEQMMYDVLFTLTGLVLLNIIAQLNMSDDVLMLCFITTVYAGILLALRHTIPLMTWTYSLLFTFVLVFIWINYNVVPILSIAHLLLVVTGGMLVYLYRMILQRAYKESKQLNSWYDLFPLVIYTVCLIYIVKWDNSYFTHYVENYLVFTVIAIAFIILLLMKASIIGRILPVVAGGVYVIAACILFSATWVGQEGISIALMLRFLYLGVLWAIVADIWLKGRIYNNYKKYVVLYEEKIIIISSLISIVALFSMTDYMHLHAMINWSTAVISNTVFVFIMACFVLFFAAQRQYRSAKVTGIGLLFFGLIKMIFFDLSALDVLIRSVLFIAIGAIGLVISNKLLEKDKNE